VREQQQQQQQQQQLATAHADAAVVCFNCKESGHKVKDCPRRRNAVSRMEGDVRLARLLSESRVALAYEPEPEHE
jgi:hypothetical protein